MPFHTCMDMNDKEEAYASFKNMFKKVIDKHAPMKSKFIRGTHAPFMNKELSKAIMHRSNWRTYTIKPNPKSHGKHSKDNEISVLLSNVKMSERISLN